MAPLSKYEHEHAILDHMSFDDEKIAYLKKGMNKLNEENVLYRDCRKHDEAGPNQKCLYSNSHSTD